MQILFTTSNSLLSRLIRRVTEESVSHCAISCGGWIIHSNLRGLHVELPQTFEKHSHVVHSVEIPFDHEKLLAALARFEHRGYDIGALLYLGLRALFPFLPKVNLWQTSGMFLCTEWVTTVLGGTEDSTITPFQLYLKLSSGG